MALQKTVDLPTDYGESVTIQDMYIKISEVRGDKYKMTALVTYHRSKGAESIYNKRVLFDTQLDSNFIEQGYLHLKTLPEFDGALDV